MTIPPCTRKRKQILALGNRSRRIFTRTKISVILSGSYRFTKVRHLSPSNAIPVGQHTHRDALPRNISWYYVMEAGMSTGFIMGNWIFFWLRYMTYGQFGLIDGLSYGFGMFMEIPTGALSDMLGKRRTLIAAMGCEVLGMLLIASTTTLEQLVIGFLMQQIGWAFYSGASESLAYDSLKEHGREAEYSRVLSRVGMIGTFVFIITTLMGSGLYLLNFRLPHFVCAMAYCTSLLAAFMLREPYIDPAEKIHHANALASFRAQIVNGVRQLRTPALRPFMLLIFIVSGVYTLYRDGLVQPTIGISFGFDATAQSLITVVSGIVSVCTLALFAFLTRRLGEWRGMIIIAFALGLGWMLAALPLGGIGVLVMLLMRLAGDLSRPWISLIVNQHLESSSRATALSSISLLSKLPYVVTAFVAGQLIEAGVLWVFNLVLGLLVMLALIVTVINAVRQKSARASSNTP